MMFLHVFLFVAAGWLDVLAFLQRCCWACSGVGRRLVCVWAREFLALVVCGVPKPVDPRQYACTRLSSFRPPLPPHQPCRPSVCFLAEGGNP